MLVLPLIASCVLFGQLATATAVEPFTVVLLPDTQKYAMMSPVNNPYSVQTAWIANNMEAENIKFMIHLGDIVNDGNTYLSQWQIADAAHDILEQAPIRVPYSVLPGNHDMAGSGAPTYTRDTTRYSQFFGPSRFEDQPWYGGNLGGSNENNYNLFSAAGMDFMVLNLEYLARDDTLAWANSVLDAHPNHRVIVATHRYLTAAGARDVTTEHSGFIGNNANQVFDKLIKNHDNVFMVVCGHAHGEALNVANNASGGRVYEILGDYQTLTNGGNGWLRTLRFSPDTNQIAVGSYSPLLDESNLWGSYTLTYDMGGVTPPLTPVRVSARFNDGATSSSVDGYPGKAGDGWGGAWAHTVTSNGGAAGTVSVLSSQPLKPGEDSGNYAHVVNTHGPRDDGTPSYSGFCRDYKVSAGGIDWTKEHTVQFSIRIDEDLTTSNFSSVNDRYHISNVNNTRNTDTTASWMVTVCGGAGTYAGADDVGEWIFHDGNRDNGAMDVTRTVSSNIVVEKGTIYDFTIVVDPETRSYVGTVTDGMHTFTTGTLGWRRSSTEIGDYLMFDTRGGDNPSMTDVRQYSIDNIVISQGIVPVPGDADGDGKVDGKDAALLAQHWGATTRAAGLTWRQMGDFNNDGRIGPEDAAILAANWGHGLNEEAARSAPEPGSVGLLMILGLGLLACHTRRVA
ncbi:MAG: hypothetical protein GX621_12800 [Pirellulaceae bacterium]|nr:hypothetical protein [Pirellulaceae bacterium]